MNNTRQGIFVFFSSDSLLSLYVFVVVVLFCFVFLVIVQELCESRSGRPGLSVLTSLLVSADVKLY